MPNIPNLKPIIKISEKQFKQLLKRVLNSEGGIKPEALDPIVEGFTQPPKINFGQTSGPIQPSMQPVTGPAPIDQLIQNVEPVDRTMGRLYRPNPRGEGSEIPVDYPWAEARIKALRDSNLIPENRPNMPPTTRLRNVSAESPENIAGSDYTKGLAYERLHWKPIESRTQEVNRAIVQQVLEESGIPVNKEQASDIATVFNAIWKQHGGMRSGEGKYWEALRSTSRHKDVHPDARSYFIRSATMWKEHPDTFSRQFPREASRLSDMWTRYMEGSKKE
jgi:hypothetical protein